MSKKTTKKASKTEPAGELRTEYRLDYAQSKPNRFAGKTKAVVVMLESDVAKVFKDGKAVNSALRAIMQAVPRRAVR
jgi:hypothetical protein